MNKLKQITLLLLLFISVNTYSTECCKSSLALEVQTKTIAQGNGNLTLQFNLEYLVGQDSLFIDSVWYNVVNNEGISIGETVIPTGLITGESPQLHQLDLSYNTEIPPFYLQEFQVYMRINK